MMAGRQARKEVPRWKRKHQLPPGLVVLHNGKPDRKLTAQLHEQQPALTAVTGVARPAPQLRTAPWRFRLHLVPFTWLALLGGSLLAHHLNAGPAAVAGLAAAGVITVIFTRHLRRFPRVTSQASCAITMVTGTLTAWLGVVHVLSWLFLLAWAGPAALWANHYRWRPAEPVTRRPASRSTAEIWAEMCQAQKWTAWLGEPKQIPSGEQYTVFCKGTRTQIDQIVGKPSAVAAAFDKPLTEAFVSADPQGIKSRGIFTRLRTGTLDDIVDWDGRGMDTATGLARVGRFPDGQPVHERWFTPGEDGVSHAVVAGATGAGKTGLLNLGLAISVASGMVCPVILDPQYGQALPAWREHVTYACGAGECVVLLEGLHGAMMDRSDFLGSVEWRDARGRRRKGMGFYDPVILAANEIDLPVIEVVIDEAPELLAVKGALRWVEGIAKLGRKTGVRLKLAVQVPSLKELGDQALRSMLVSGNVFCLRTGDKVSGNMLNIGAAPWELPHYFRNGARTYGLGYAFTGENRPDTPMRIDRIADPYTVAERYAQWGPIRSMDDRFAAKVAEIVAAADADAGQLNQAAASVANMQLYVLGRVGSGKTRGELITACSELKLSEVTSAITTLTAGHKLSERGGVLRLV